MQSERRVGYPLASRLCAAVTMATGAALLAHILARVSLRLALGYAVALMVLAVAATWRRAQPLARTRLAQRVKLGMASGLVATIAYDSSKYVLSRWDPARYHPFEVIRIFGALLAGPSASPLTQYLTGGAYHLSNGICFGIAFCLLFGRRGVLAGIGWGLFLETFQLTLYPGWLQMRSYTEFAQMSALGHVVYGAVLGTGCRWGLRRWPLNRVPRDWKSPPGRASRRE